MNVFQIVCEQKVIKGFGIEYYELRNVGRKLYKNRKSAEERIEELKKSTTFKDCRFTINMVYYDDIE